MEGLKLSKDFLKMSKQEFSDTLKRTRKLKAKEINELYKQLHGHDLGSEGQAEEPGQ